MPGASSSPTSRTSTAPASRVSPVWLVLIGILSVQVGAVISKGQFGEIPPVGMVFLRLTTSAVILLAVARPRLRGRSALDWRPVLALGLTLGAMNWAFYESFARIPIGVAVTIEFIGPLSVAALGSRRPRDLGWVGLAAVGIALFGVGPTKVDPVGFGLALLAGVCWAIYILSTAATGRRWPGVEGLAVASTIGMLAIAPFAVAIAGPQLGHPIQPGDDGVAHAPAARLRHPHEPRAGRRGPGCRRPAERVADATPARGDGLRHGRERRRRPDVVDLDDRRPGLIGRPGRRARSSADRAPRPGVVVP
jgi:inner membrane transporter RhtA